MPITAPLPNLNTAANAGPAPKPADSGADNGQFGAALSREVDQRGKASSHDAGSQADAAARPQETAPAAPGDSKPAKTGAAGRADAKEDDDDASADATGTDAAAAAAAPAADMLAMVASIQQLLKPGALAPEAAPAAATAAAVAGAAARKPAAPTGEPDTLAAALPGDAGARFAALMRGSQPAGQDKPGTAVRATASAAAGVQADAKPGAASAGVTVQDALSPSQAPSLAPSSAPGAAPDATQAATPTTAPTLPAAEHLAASLAPTAAPDPAAAQLLAAAQSQQLAPAAAQAAAQAAGAANHIPAQLGSSHWNDQVGQKIVWMVAGGDQSASLTLNPPDLGPMQVVLSVNGDQASVAFSSSHEDVRHALESAMPRLREMMGESGIALGSATVSAGMPDGRQAQGEWQAGARGGARNDGGADVADDTPAPRPATRTTVLGGRGMVDTFA